MLYMKKSIWRKGQRYKILIHLFFIVLSLLFILPIVLVVSISFSSEASVTAQNAGFSLLPRDFSLDAYKLAFSNGSQLVKGYIVTMAQATLGTVLQLIVAGMVSYSLSRSSFAYKGPISFMIFFTMLFSGGMIPTYIVYSTYYHLNDSFWVYILPGIAGGAWNTMMMRTFFKGIPESLFESAKLDGCSEFGSFWRIAVPLSKPVFATVGFMTLVAKWNDWNTSLVYIRDENLYTLQYLLQRILNEAEYLKSLIENPLFAQTGLDMNEVMVQPSETLKYAMCVIAAGPMLLVFPFFQKYFVKGTTVGAVKG